MIDVKLELKHSGIAKKNIMGGKGVARWRTNWKEH